MEADRLRDLYVKMLGQALPRPAASPAPDKSDCLVDITVDAFLPEEYIPDAAGRIEAYKRIAAIETTSDAEDVLGRADRLLRQPAQERTGAGGRLPRARPQPASALRRSSSARPADFV